MSVFTSLRLDCNGCTARFIPAVPVSLAGPLREAAAAAGWRTPESTRDLGNDWCPVCADSLPARPKRPRGICAECGHEQVVRADTTVVYHTRKERDRYGRRLPCDGSGKPPQRLTRFARPVDHDWKRSSAHRA